MVTTVEEVEMEASILNSTKKMLGIAPEYTAFDLEIINYINLAFSTVNQLGVGPVDGFQIEDDESKWEDLGLPNMQTNMVKTYVYLRVRMIFDPPSTSFAIDALQKQLEEHEWRLNVMREETAWTNP